MTRGIWSAWRWTCCAPRRATGDRFRLVGAGVSNFRRPEPGNQLALFTSPDGTPLRKTIATLRDRFGDASIDWADGDWANSD